MGEVDIRAPLTVTEVLDELSYRAVRANDEHHLSERDLGSSFLHAMESGKQLNVVRASLQEASANKKYIGMDAWLKQHFDGHKSTAYEYMRLDRERETLVAAPDYARLSITEARRILSPPEGEEKPKEDGLERAERLRLKAQESAKKAQAAKREETAKAKALRADIKALKSAQKEREKAISAELKQNLQEQLADVYAHYGITETPRAFEVDPAHFQAAISKSRNEREIEALKLLEQSFALVSKMRKFEPEEAARAFSAACSITSKTMYFCDRFFTFGECNFLLVCRGPGHPEGYPGPASLG